MVANVGDHDAPGFPRSSEDCLLVIVNLEIIRFAYAAVKHMFF